jgi:hypothetical protein
MNFRSELARVAELFATLAGLVLAAILAGLTAPLAVVWIVADYVRDR